MDSRVILGYGWSGNHEEALNKAEEQVNKKLAELNAKLTDTYWHITSATTASLTGTALLGDRYHEHYGTSYDVTCTAVAELRPK